MRKAFTKAIEFNREAPTFTLRCNLRLLTLFCRKSFAQAHPSSPIAVSYLVRLG